MLKKETLTVFLAVIIIVMIGFGITAATGGLNFFGIKPSIVSSANLVGAWSLNESDLTEKVLYESDFSSDEDGFVSSGTMVIGNQDNISDGVTSFDDCLKITVDSSTGDHIVYKNLDGGLNSIKVSFKYYIPASNVDATYLYIYNGVYPTISATTVGTWVEYVGYHNVMDISVRYRLGGNSYVGNGTDHIYIKDLKYSASDISIKDSSGNSNDGEIMRTNLVDSEGIENFTLNGDGSVLYIIASDIKSANRTYRYTFRVTDAASGGTVKVSHTTYTSDDRTVDDNGNSFGSIGVKTLTFTTNSDIGFASRVQVAWFNSVNGDDYAVTDFKVEDITFEKDQNNVSNQAMSFDGVEDYIDLGDLGNLGDEFTYSVWFKTDSNASYNMF